MRRVRTDNPDRLEYKAGGGCTSLFGLPFFCMGCLFAFLGATGQMKSKGGAPITGPAMIMPVVFGGVFALVGAAFLFGRSGLILDRSRKTITRWYGLLIPMWSKDHEWGRFGEVAITREVRRSKNSTYTVFPVRLTGGGAPLNVSEPREEQAARQLAEEIAKFMDLAMADSSGGTTVRREAGTLDEPLRDRLRREQDEVDITTPPAGMRAEFSASGNAVSFKIPPAPLNPLLFAPVGCAVVFSLLVGGFFLLPMLNQQSMPAETKWIFGGFLGVFFVALPLVSSLWMVLSKAKRRSDIEADRYGLRITTHGLLRSTKIEMSSDELEELRIEEVRGETCLSAISDKRKVRFAEGQPRGDLLWIRKVILKAIST